MGPIYFTPVHRFHHSPLLYAQNVWTIPQFKQ